MRVLQVSHGFNHLIIADIHRSLVLEGHDARLVMGGNASLLREAQPGCVIEAPGLVDTAGAASGAVAALRSAIDQYCPDVLLYHEPPPSLASILSGLGAHPPAAGFVHTVICPGGKLLRRHDTLCEARMSLGGCLTRWYTGPCGSDKSPAVAWREVRASLTRADAMRELPAMLVASRSMRGHLLHEGFDPMRVHVIDPGYRPEAGMPIPPPTGAGRRRLLVVGRLIYAKGVQNLLRAVSLAGADRFEVEIVGDGYYRPALEQLAAELRLPHVTFSGWKDGDEVTAAYRRADLVVMPSLVPESFGTVPAEAAGFGVPALVSDRGALPEWREVLPSVAVVDVSDLPAFALALAAPLPKRTTVIKRSGRPSVGVVLAGLLT